MKLIQSPWYGEENSQRVVTFAFIAIALIAVADAVIIPFLGLGYLFLIPLTIAAAFLSRWQILIIAGICTAFSEGFSKLPDGGERYPRVVFMFATYLVVPLVMREMARYRRAAARRLAELERDVSAFRTSEQDLELLINSSAVGILTISPEGNIVTCNRTAHEVFSVDAGGLVGLPIGRFLPVTPGQDSTAPIECQGTAADGRTFGARVWASTFSSADTRMTVLFIDAAQTTVPLKS